MGNRKGTGAFWGEGSDNVNVFLIENFGDGRINTFDENGNLLGQLRSHGNPIEFEGLWGITFAPSTSTALNRNCSLRPGLMMKNKDCLVI